MVNYVSLQRLADKLIKGFGGGANNASLRRGGVDRACSAVVVQFSASERKGDMFQWGDKKVLISALNLDPEPDNEQDTLVMNDGIEYKIAGPPVLLAPDNTNVLYWEVVARK